LGKPHWAKGYGQQALSLLVDFAFRHNNMHRVGLEVLADDERAVGCYLKVGFVEEGRLRKRDWVNGAYHDVMVMGILDEEWPG
jgi:RimJ/RimL family protein N-acetyltransferase